MFIFFFYVHIVHLHTGGLCAAYIVSSLFWPLFLIFPGRSGLSVLIYASFQSICSAPDTFRWELFAHAFFSPANCRKYAIMVEPQSISGCAKHSFFFKEKLSGLVACRSLWLVCRSVTASCEPPYFLIGSKLEQLNLYYKWLQHMFCDFKGQVYNVMFKI